MATRLTEAVEAWFNGESQQIETGARRGWRSWADFRQEMTYTFEPMAETETGRRQIIELWQTGRVSGYIQRFRTLRYKIPSVAWKRGSSDSRCTPCEISTLQQSRVVSRDDCTVAVGPHSRRSPRTDAAAIASEPNPDAHAHSTVDKTDYKILAWRSHPNGDRRCSSHLSHHRRSNVRGTTIYNISESPGRMSASR